LGGTYPCPPGVLARFVAGQLDDRRIQELVPALSLLNWEQAVPKWEGGRVVEPAAYDPARAGLPGADAPPGESLWAAFPVLCYLKPLFQPSNFLIDLRQHSGARAFGERPFPPRAPAALAALLAGNLPNAVEEATGRLRSCGLRPVRLPLESASAGDCARLAAALLLPCPVRGLRRALRRIPEIPVPQRQKDNP